MKTALLLGLLVLGACSTRAWYEGMQNGAEDACRRKPEAEAQRCLDRLNRQGYDDYEKTRSK